MAVLAGGHSENREGISWEIRRLLLGAFGSLMYFWNAVNLVNANVQGAARQFSRFFQIMNIGAWQAEKGRQPIQGRNLA